MIRNVFVTGAGGFAGAHFLDHALQTSDWNITCTDSFRHKGKTDRVAECIKGAEEYDAKVRVKVLTHDLTTPFSAQFAALAGNVDWMVCYASESHVTRSISDPVPFIRNNVDVALNTLELARTLKPQGVIWVSTDEVAGPLEANGEPHSEWCVTRPSNPYSASKASQESIAFSYWRTYGVPVVIIRCMNMFGERQDQEKFIPLAISRIARGDEVIIHTDGEGNVGSRNYLHARNLADGIKFIMNEGRPLLFGDYTPSFRLVDRPDMYNVVAPGQVNNLALAHMIADEVGIPLRYRKQSAEVSRPGHDLHYGLDPSKLYALGWEPPVDFEESLRKTVQWTLKNDRWLLP